MTKTTTTHITHCTQFMQLFLFESLTDEKNYLVILESLYGMWEPFLLGSPRAPITFPRARRPLFIWMLSFSLSPVFPVLKMRSEPARSTKWNLEDSIWVPELAALPNRRELPRRWSMYTVKMVCDRLELGFIWVEPVCLAVFPDSSKLNTSSRPSTSHSLTPHKTIKSQRQKNPIKHKVTYCTTCRISPTEPWW